MPCSFDRHMWGQVAFQAIQPDHSCRAPNRVKEHRSGPKMGPAYCIFIRGIQHPYTVYQTRGKTSHVGNGVISHITTTISSRHRQKKHFYVQDSFHFTAEVTFAGNKKQTCMHPPPEHKYIATQTTKMDHRKIYMVSTQPYLIRIKSNSIDTKKSKQKVSLKGRN